MQLFSIGEKLEKNNPKPPYFTFVIAVLNLIAKVNMFQINLMGDHEVCEPEEES